MRTQRELEMALLEANKDQYIFWRMLGQLLMIGGALAISLIINHYQ